MLFVIHSFKKYYIDHLLLDRGTHRPIKKTTMKNSCNAGEVLDKRVAQKVSVPLPGWVTGGFPETELFFEMDAEEVF